MKNLEKWRQRVRAEGIVGALPIETLQSFYREATARRPTHFLRWPYVMEKMGHAKKIYMSP